MQKFLDAEISRSMYPNPIYVPKQPLGLLCAHSMYMYMYLNSLHRAVYNNRLAYIYFALLQKTMSAILLLVLLNAWQKYTEGVAGKGLKDAIRLQR